MGLRGPGAGRLYKARAAVSERKQRLPWKRKKLGRAERVIAFLEWLPVTKGILVGKRMRLLPDQLEFVRAVYGPSRPDGRRLVSLAIKSAPKGSGKTGLVAGLALCHLLGPESEPRGEVYSAAIDRQQAAIVFAEMEATILQVPEFAARVNIRRWHKGIEVVGGDGEGSIYEALSSDARRAHGLAPSLWVYDELGQAKERTLLDNLLEGMGKRKEALGIVISTQAATDDHPLSQLIDDAATGEDETMVLRLLSAPADADPFDDDVIRACNPAWGHFLDLDDLMRSKERARRNPASEPAFRNLRLNQRVNANDDDRIVTGAVWALGDVRVDAKALEGRSCYGGLDLSGKHDLTAFVLAFPDEKGGFDLLPFFWTPLGQLEARKPGEAARFRQWIKDGHMVGLPGAVIDDRAVAAQLGTLARRFKILAIGYDRWRIDYLKLELDRAHLELPLEPFGQGYKDMGPAVETFTELALMGHLRHGGHPVLTACVAAAVLSKPDDAGGQKFAKGRANAGAPVRIDGVVAAAMALQMAKRAEANRERKPDYQIMFV